ncbi:DUF6973 domain-containing protein [Saccharopolyspora montiporae]|uniref:DUF6973 domain-containing protein n=1 Tax=Saccharopolyspora montiporae TaxID=2781240 RepID=UPI003F882F95
MAVHIGADQATEVGDLPENNDPNRPGERAMDLHNTAVGRGAVPPMKPRHHRWRWLRPTMAARNWLRPPADPVRHELRVLCLRVPATARLTGASREPGR